MIKAIQQINYGLYKALFAWAAFLYILIGLTFATFLMIGLWDLMAWAFRTDWRTSHFDVPAILLISMVILGFMAYISYLLGRGFRLAAEERPEGPGSAGYYIAVISAGILLLVAGWFLV
jgi:hypothetical protein